MFEWYLKKIDEFIQVAHYCRHPILEAHFVLARRALIESHSNTNAKPTSPNDALAELISLSLEQARIDENEVAADHLDRALAALQSGEDKTEKVVSVTFKGSKRGATRQHCG